MAKETEDRAIILSDVLLRYCDLDKPVATIKGGKEKFRVTVINDRSSSKYADNKRKIEESTAAAESASKLREGVIQKVKDPKRRFYQDGSDFTNDDDEIIEGFEGKDAVVIKASSNDRPTLWDREKDDVDEDQIEKVFKPGCRVDVKIWPYAVDDEDKGGRGGFWTLNVVRYRKKDRTFTTASVAPNKDDFDDVEDDDFDDDIA